MKIASRICRGVTALTLLQTLYLRYTGSEESVYIFTTVGAEPVGRIGSGVVELIASILLLVPGLIWLGAGPDLLWKGIAAYAKTRNCGYLSGCSSLTSQDLA